MKKHLFALLVLVVVLQISTSANAQYVVLSSTGNTPGVDLPLFDFGEYFDRDNFNVGDLNASYSLLRLENYPTFLAPRVVPSGMSLVATGGAPTPHAWNTPATGGPAVYPQRPPRVSQRESTTYNGIDWRGVVPPAGQTWTYTQYAFIEWGPGTSIYTGNTYAAGFALVAFDYTITN